MTGAGRLSSGPQPVMAYAAPLCLSCTCRARPRCREISLLAVLPSRMEDVADCRHCGIGHPINSAVGRKPVVEQFDRRIHARASAADIV